MGDEGLHVLLQGLPRPLQQNLADDARVDPAAELEASSELHFRSPPCLACTCLVQPAGGLVHSTLSTSSSACARAVVKAAYLALRGASGNPRVLRRGARASMGVLGSKRSDRGRGQGHGRERDRERRQGGRGRERDRELLQQRALRTKRAEPGTMGAGAGPTDGSGIVAEAVRVMRTDVSIFAPDSKRIKTDCNRGDSTDMFGYPCFLQRGRRLRKSCTQNEG